MATEEKYNGWSNRETWALALHVDNTEAWQQMRYGWAEEAKRLAEKDEILNEPRYHLASMLKSWAEEVYERVFFDPAASVKDERMMVNDVGSLWRVDFDEIARNWLAE